MMELIKPNGRVALGIVEWPRIEENPLLTVQHGYLVLFGQVGKDAVSVLFYGKSLGLAGQQNLS
jgi:hypothetical protein